MKTIDFLDNMVLCYMSTEQEPAQEIRLDKVRQVRRKLKSGKYNPDEYLSLAADRLIEEILMRNPDTLNQFIRC